MKIKLLSIVLLNSILISCQLKERTNNNDAEIIQISKKEIRDEIDVGKMVEEVRYVELETTEESLIGNVSKVIAYKDKIYIKDRFVASKIYIFDATGRFITTVSSTGKGPGEYMSLEDIAIDSYKDELLVNDTANKKILVFDLGGEFLREFKIPYWASNIYALRESYLFNLYQEELDHNLLLMDKESLEIRKDMFFPAVLGRDGVGLNAPFFEYSTEVLFTFSLIDEIYNITDIEAGNIRTKYILDFKEVPPIEAIINKENMEVYEFLTSSDYCYHSFLINETSRWLLFNFMLGDKKKFAFYDKKEKSIHLGDSVTNHTDGKPFSMPMFSTGDELVAVLYSFEVEDRDDELNPLLAFYKFKDGHQ